MPGPNLIRDETCPFCRFNLRGRNAVVIHNKDAATVQCPVCGPYEMVGTAVDLFEHWPISHSPNGDGLCPSAND
jgi:hypothetical protein